MSAFTDFAHEWALRETLYWADKVPQTPQEIYEYGEYRYRLTDYREAAEAYYKASEQESIPARFKLARCMAHDLGCDGGDAQRLFRSVIRHDVNSFETAALYRLGMCYTYGYGIEPDEKQGFSFFWQLKETLAEVQYEIGLFYRDGKGGIPCDRTAAEQWLRKAYDGYFEEAIFALFELYDSDFEKFPYQREIKEGYSFRLGRLMRSAESEPCSEYLNRLADFYHLGYPGDTGEKLDKFKMLAQKYYKKAGIQDVK